LPIGHDSLIRGSASAASSVLRPSDNEELGTQGPRRASKKELHAAFAEGWSVESIEPTRAEVRPDLKDLTFSDGGPKAWFAVVRRGGDTALG